MRTPLLLFVVIMLTSLLGSGSASAQALSGSAESAFETALEAFKANDYTKAHRYAEYAHKTSPTTEKYGDLYGWTLLKTGRIPEAVAVHAHFKAYDPNYIETIQLGAWLAYTLRDFKTADAEFKRQIAWVDGHRATSEFRRRRYKVSDYNFIYGIAADANYGLALVALERGEMADALKLLELATSTQFYSGRKDALLALAEVQSRQGNAAGAAATMQTLTEEFGADAVAPIMARTYLLSPTPARAVEAVAPLAAKAPGNPYYPMVQALGLAASGRSAEADQALAKALALSPNAFPAADLVDMVVIKSPAARQWLSGAGRRFYDQGNFAGARFLLYSPAAAGDCPSMIMAGWSNHYAGYPAYALAWFKSATTKACAPREEAVLGQGVAEMALGHLDAADKLFVQATTLNKNYGRAKVARGAVSYFRGDYAGAIKIYTANAAAIPERETYWGWGSNALNNLGWSYYFTGDFKSAETTFGRLEGYIPGRGFAASKVGIGWALQRQGKSDQARLWFEKALALDPGNILAKQGLGK